jgi:hypothetical protein
VEAAQQAPKGGSPVDPFALNHCELIVNAEVNSPEVPK